MINILNEIFTENGFLNNNIEWEGWNSNTYTNSESETYIMLFLDYIPSDIVYNVFEFCSNVLYITEILSKAQKSNLNIVIISKISANISDLEKNIVFKVEENDLYYKKFLLWYGDDEVQALKKICNNNFSMNILDNILLDREKFRAFKNNEIIGKGYCLLSRIYIKLAFLTLNNIKTLNKNLSDYINDSMSSINSNLYNYVINNDNDNDNEFIENSLEYVVLSEKEIIKIESELEEII